VIEGLAEFRLALKAAAGKAPSALNKGLKRAGDPILARAAAAVPHKTGALAAGFRTAVVGPRADIISRVPYAGGAEWGRFGKWAGFGGGSPRFVWPAIEAEQEQITNTVYEELRQVAEAFGWFHP
jgi:hypothetical protein